MSSMTFLLIPVEAGWALNRLCYCQVNVSVTPCLEKSNEFLLSLLKCKLLIWQFSNSSPVLLFHYRKVKSLLSAGLLNNADIPWLR